VGVFNFKPYKLRLQAKDKFCPQLLMVSLVLIHNMHAYHLTTYDMPRGDTAEFPEKETFNATFAQKLIRLGDINPENVCVAAFRALNDLGYRCNTTVDPDVKELRDFIRDCLKGVIDAKFRTNFFGEKSAISHNDAPDDTSSEGYKLSIVYVPKYDAVRVSLASNHNFWGSCTLRSPSVYDDVGVLPPSRTCTGFLKS